VLPTEQKKLQPFPGAKKRNPDRGGYRSQVRNKAGIRLKEKKGTLVEKKGDRLTVRGGTKPIRVDRGKHPATKERNRGAQSRAKKRRVQDEWQKKMGNVGGKKKLIAQILGG